MLDKESFYLQISFESNLALMLHVVPRLVCSERILIAAGEPYLRREGVAGIQAMRRLWLGHIVADLKTVSGTLQDVDVAYEAGATSATVLGSMPPKILDRFVTRCAALGMDSMLDMLGVDDPLAVVAQLRKPPDVAVVYPPRDNGGWRGEADQYRCVDCLTREFGVLVSAAGCVDPEDARSAICSGASIVVARFVRQRDGRVGASAHTSMGVTARQFLEATAQPAASVA